MDESEIIANIKTDLKHIIDTLNRIERTIDKIEQTSINLPQKQEKQCNDLIPPHFMSLHRYIAELAYQYIKDKGSPAHRAELMQYILSKNPTIFNDRSEVASMAIISKALSLDRRFVRAFYNVGKKRVRGWYIATSDQNLASSNIISQSASSENTSLENVPQNAPLNTIQNIPTNDIMNDIYNSPKLYNMIRSIINKELYNTDEISTEERAQRIDIMIKRLLEVHGIYDIDDAHLQSIIEKIIEDIMISQQEKQS